MNFKESCEFVAKNIQTFSPLKKTSPRAQALKIYRLLATGPLLSPKYKFRLSFSGPVPSNYMKQHKIGQFFYDAKIIPHLQAFAKHLKAAKKQHCIAEEYIM